ncbi:MAG: hypothetical protein GY797_18655 [Deltaproteobacteria bacterium]|nr:hypothetical protein [Deltaproteobacteria bacterium]
MKYNEKSSLGKNQNFISATVDQINDYTEKVIKGLIFCILPPCPRCGLEPLYFNRHEARKRKFYVVFDQIVKTVQGLLIRWKCPGCKKTFTQYPDFALPYKRYTLPTIMEFCGRYTECEKATYRKVRIDNLLGYEDSEKQMEHTTIHRWICTLGDLQMTSAKAVDLILQANCLSTICRDMAKLSINPKKYQTPERKTLLERCRRLFRIEALFLVIFKISIFPKLATTCRFT